MTLVGTVFALAGDVRDTLDPRSIGSLGGALVIRGAALIASQNSVRTLTV